MNIRPMTMSDIEELKEIHDKFFKNEFEFPSFLEHFLSCFVVTDENDKIITGGGVRLIPEMILITNKEFHTRDRRLALLEMLRAGMFTVSLRDYNQLHAFTEDISWIRHLMKVGFKKSKGQTLVLNV